MAPTMRRSILVGTSALLLLAQVGCAARPVAVARPAAPIVYRPVLDPATDCTTYAQAEVADLRSPSAAREGLKTFGAGLLWSALAVASLGFCYACGAGPIMILGAPVQAAIVAHKNARSRDVVLTRAREVCEQPADLAAELGPLHPDVAWSLEVLAARYASLGQYGAAETLQRRAIDTYERTLPAHHPDISRSVRDLASFLRQAGRVEEAEALDARAKAISEEQDGVARATAQVETPASAASTDPAPAETPQAGEHDE